jgi:hypothetical protein
MNQREKSTVTKFSCFKRAIILGLVLLMSVSGFATPLAQETQEKEKEKIEAAHYSVSVATSGMECWMRKPGRMRLSSSFPTNGFPEIIFLLLWIRTVWSLSIRNIFMSGFVATTRIPLKSGHI